MFSMLTSMSVIHIWIFGLKQFGYDVITLILVISLLSTITYFMVRDKIR